MVNFLKAWCSIANHINNILICLQKNSFLPLGLNALLDLSSKTNRKTMLKALRTFKKLKYNDNPKLAEEARLTTLKDEWLIACEKPTPETKARIKKAAEAEKKKAEKKSKAQEKVKKKNQAMDIRKLAINYSRRIVGALKEILSDPSTRLGDFNDAIPDLLRLKASNNAILDLPRPKASNNAVLDLSRSDSSSFTSKSIFGNNTRLSNSQKKKTTQQTLIGRLKNKASISK